MYMHKCLRLGLCWCLSVYVWESEYVNEWAILCVSLCVCGWLGARASMYQFVCSHCSHRIKGLCLNRCRRGFKQDTRLLGREGLYGVGFGGMWQIELWSKQTHNAESLPLQELWTYLVDGLLVSRVAKQNNFECAKLQFPGIKSDSTFIGGVKSWMQKKKFCFDCKLLKIIDETSYRQLILTSNFQSES